MPNNTYISPRDPIADPVQNQLFSRTWFRFFDMLAKKAQLLAGNVTTSATAGVATALPALPAGYMTITIDGKDYKVPYYNA